jgi:hypothetical protein
LEVMELHLKNEQKNKQSGKKRWKLIVHIH